jgi:hypothetical protein
LNSVPIFLHFLLCIWSDRLVSGERCQQGELHSLLRWSAKGVPKDDGGWLGLPNARPIWLFSDFVAALVFFGSGLL